MAEQEKIFPGSIDRYRKLRELREQAENNGGVDESVGMYYVSLCIAEELAGLAYIADGIRYSVRK